MTNVLGKHTFQKIVSWRTPESTNSRMKIFTYFYSIDLMEEPCEGKLLPHLEKKFFKLIPFSPIRPSGLLSGYYEELPHSWQTFCAKGHNETSEHNRKCYNWISPKVKFNLMKYFSPLYFWFREGNTRSGVRFRPIFNL